MKGPLALIALTMVLQFSSVVKSVVVMLTVPLGLIGALLGLWVTRSPLGFMALLAMVSLGVMVSHIIVLSDFIEARAKDCRSKRRWCKPVCATATSVGHRARYRRRIDSAFSPAARCGIRSPRSTSSACCLPRADVGDVANALLRVLRETEIHQVTARVMRSLIFKTVAVEHLGKTTAAFEFERHLPPHPGPLPRGEGETFAALDETEAPRALAAFSPAKQNAALKLATMKFPKP